MEKTDYKCLLCNQTHYKGKIYKDHRKYDLNNIPNNRIIDYDNKDLRSIAKRQIGIWINKINKIKNNPLNSSRVDLYYQEINKIILLETNKRG